MNRTIQNALRLALSRRNYDFGGVAQPDEEDQEAFLKEQLKGSAPQYEPEAGFKTAKEAALMGAGFAPGAGLATAAGKFPTAEGGYEPSMKEDWREGRYGSAVMKGLGAAGDVVSAVPVAGTALGTAMKAPLALKLATAMAPAARLAQEAAPVAKAVEETPAYQRLINPAGFYSRAHEAAMLELPEGARTWQEMRSILAKRPGVKETELQWSGLHPEAFDPQQKITREEIAKRVEQNFPMVERVVKSKEAAKTSFYDTPEFAAHREVFLNDFKNDYAQDLYGKNYDALSPEEISHVNTALEQAAREEANAFMARNVDEAAKTPLAPMHEQYTVPGGENYSERVLTHQYTDPKLVSEHPDVREKYSKEYMSLFDEDMQISEQLDQRRRAGEYNTPEVKDLERREQENAAAMNKLRQKIFEESKALAPYQPEYTQSQFRHQSHLGDINNPILHTRNSERVGPNGERILHQEEVQSDWAQRGREKGFKATEQELNKANQIFTQAKRTVGDTFDKLSQSGLSEKEIEQHPEFLKVLSDEKTAAEKVGDINLRLRSGIPTAPHVEDTEQWLDLAAKDTLSHAIENGFDKVFITGGQEQAKRWSNELRKSIDNVRWEPGPEEGTKNIYAYPLGADPGYRFYRFLVKPVESKGKIQNQVVESSLLSAKGETLSSVIGSDLAKRIMAEESGNVPMKGYRMGSEGYTQTYERKYPSSFKKLMKQLDPEAKVEAGNLGEARPTYNFPDLGLDSLLYLDAKPGFKPAWNKLHDRLISGVSGGSDIGSVISDIGNPDFADWLAKTIGAGRKTGEEPVAGTYINITPKMREKYFELKEKHGAVFPAYKDGGSVDSFLNASYNEPRKRFIDHALKVSRKHAK